MTKTLWIIEATCPRCGEQYNPESLNKKYIQHWCQDEAFGGSPDKVWMYYLGASGQMIREEKTMKKKFRILWKEVGVALLVCAATVGLVWSMMTGWFG
jgi:hypothetical protein